MKITEAMEAFSIIQQYSEPDDELSVGHDQIWFGKYTGEKMNEGHKKTLDQLGWFDDEEAWSSFV